MSDDCEVAIIGGGCVGLATAVRVLELGGRPTVYERHRPGAGQSVGASRILRFNHADRRLVPFIQESVAHIERWGAEDGESYLGRSRVVNVGPAVEARHRVLTDCGIAASICSKKDQRALLPIARGWDSNALVDPGGPLWTQRLVAALSRRTGTAIVQRDVLAVTVRGDGAVDVVTGDGTIVHRRVVVAAGSGTPDLLAGLEVRVPLRRTTHLRGDFAVRRPGEPLACLQDSSQRYGPAVYAAPHPGWTRYAVGLSGAEGELDDEGDDAASTVRARTQAYVARALPGLDPTGIKWNACRVTRLPWGSDGAGVYGRGPVMGPAGHNLWKWSPALGDRLARWALGAELDPVLDPEQRLGHAGA